MPVSLAHRLKMGPPQDKLKSWNCTWERSWSNCRKDKNMLEHIVPFQWDTITWTRVSPMTYATSASEGLLRPFAEGVENSCAAGNRQICSKAQSYCSLPPSYLFRNLKTKENWLHLITYKNAEKVFITHYKRVNTYKVSATHPESKVKEVDCQFVSI